MGLQIESDSILEWIVHMLDSELSDIGVYVKYVSMLSEMMEYSRDIGD